MATRILVVGATGTTGKPLVELLSKKEGIVVRAATRAPGQVAQASSIEYVPLFYNDASSIQQALQEVQKVYLVTPFLPEMMDYESKVIGQMKNAGIQHVVKLSVVGADQENRLTPQHIHRQLELLIQDSGIPYTFLRPTYFMQNYAHFMAQTIKTQNAFFMPLGKAKINPVDARDLAAVALKALTERGHEGKAYTLIGPEALSNYEIAAILSDVLGREIKYVAITDEQARQAMLTAGTPEWFIARMEEINRMNREGLLSPVSHDLEKVTGTRPTTFREFARDYADAFS